MPPVTIEAIDAKQTEISAQQTELSKLIAQFKEQANRPVVHSYPQVDIVLQPDEHYAGPILNELGDVLHHVVLMAQRPAKKLNWKAAMDWATGIQADGIDSSLPTRRELALLFANCKAHVEPVWHWSCETHESDASYAWGCGFDDGYFDDYHKSYEGSAGAVRRIHFND